MNIKEDRRTRVLSELLHAKEWRQVLPDPAIELLTAVLDDGSHVRDAIDARLRTSPDSRAGLSTTVWLSGSPSRQRSLAELLDLLTVSGLFAINHCGEYEVNADVPRLLDASSRPLFALLVSRDVGRAPRIRGRCSA